MPTQIPNSTAGSQEWIAWHQSLKKSMSSSQANELFLQAFKKYGSYNANNNELRNYAQSQGMSIEGGLGSSVYDGFANTFGAFNSGGAKIGSFAILGVVIVLVMIGFLMWSVFKK